MHAVLERLKSSNIWLKFLNIAFQKHEFHSEFNPADLGMLARFPRNVSHTRTVHDVTSHVCLFHRPLL